MRPDTNSKDKFRSPVAKQNTANLNNITSSQKPIIRKKTSEPIRNSNREDLMPQCLANYFSKNEFQEAVENSQLPPADLGMIIEEDGGVESDSDPSCDNFDAQDLKDVFEEALSEDDIKTLMAQAKASKPKEVEKKDYQSELKVVIEESSEHVVASATLKENDQKVKEETQNSMIINNLDDYKAIVQKVIDAKKETKRLSQKFEVLQKQLDRKLKVELCHGVL